MPELDRINFLIERDGIDKALSKIRENLFVYQEHINKRLNQCKEKSYRYKFEESIKEMEGFIKKNSNN